MKKAILYIRVSTDEQAEHGCSLPDQEIKLKKYCKANNIEVAAVYQDDYTAKAGFDRPGYNKLRQFLVIQKKSINYILVTQWSRFSRNMYEALGEMKRLKEMGVEVNAIEQLVDLSIPENLFMAAIYMAAPQVENERLALRTIAGMRQAIRQGRYIYTSPKGYKSNKLTKDIEIDAKCAELVQWCFSEFSKGIYSAEDVRYRANKKGLGLCKQAFLNMLQNQVYLGKVYLKEYKDENAEWFTGTHPALIDKHTFDKVQYILKRRSKPYKHSREETQNDLPLRGYITCPKCNKKLTGSKAKGNGGRYPYYHCQQTKYGCNFRVSAKVAHDAMLEYLKTFEPNEEVVKLFISILTNVFNTDDQARLKEAENLVQQGKAIEEQRAMVLDHFLNQRLPVDQYNAIIKTLDEKQNDIVTKHSTVTKVPPHFDEYLNYSSQLIKNLSNYYNSSSPETKGKLISLIFPEKLIFTGEEYKTEKVNEVINLIAAAGMGLKENSPAKVARLYSEAPAAGLEPATL
jgi:site-specific DNA recombinase